MPFLSLLLVFTHKFFIFSLHVFDFYIVNIHAAI